MWYLNAEFHGTSINKASLLEPDLTKDGVLLRFREEQIGVTGNNEAMYQVKVPENERCFIQFLW